MAKRKFDRSADHEENAIRNNREAQSHLRWAGGCDQAAFEHVISANRAAQRARSALTSIGVNVGGRTKRHRRLWSIVSKTDRAVGVATRQFRKKCTR